MTLLKCPKCVSKKGKPVKFKSRAEVVTHLKNHHKMKFYYCGECNDDFEDEEIHRKFHEVFPSLCLYCPKAFKASACLYKHMYHDHPALIGLHEPNVGVTVKRDKMPSRGDNLLKRAIAIGIPTKVKLTSKDIFVAGTEEGLLKLTFHAVTPFALVGKVVTNKQWLRTLLKPGKHIGHLATAMDFGYDIAAFEASYDDLNFAYMDPHFNVAIIGSFEGFCRAMLYPRWDEIFVLTVVVYGDEDRTAASVGKAVVMHRDGEEDKIICFNFLNTSSSAASFWNQRVSLDQFRLQFGLPELYTNKPDLLECGKQAVFNCGFVRCTQVYLSEAARNEHVKICPIRLDPTAKKVEAGTHGCIYTPCLHCLITLRDIQNVTSHLKSTHEEGRVRKKTSSSSTADTTASSSSSTTGVDMEYEGKAKIARLIDTTPLSSTDVHELTNLLLNKSTTDGV